MKSTVPIQIRVATPDAKLIHRAARIKQVKVSVFVRDAAIIAASLEIMRHNERQAVQVPA